METKGLKILNNVKTGYNYMLIPFICVLYEYCPLLLKVALFNPTIQATTSNSKHLANIETLLNLVSTIHFLSIVKNLTKLAFELRISLPLI
jgi:hypothetical protein